MKNIAINPISRFLIMVVITLLILPACEDEDRKISPSTIEFSLALQNVTEGDVATIVLTLDKPAPASGSVELTFETNAIYSQHYVTDPAPSGNASILLNISQGQQSAELQITSFDNSRYEGAKFIIFQLKNATGQLRPGAATTLTLTIGDDEGPSLANFATSSAILKEEDEGIVVLIPLSAPALGEGSVTVTLDAGQAVHNANFIIDQELKDNTFSFNVVPNATSVTFTVFPVDNDLFTGNLVLRFSISEISGVVQKGNNLKYSLTLVDDELPSIVKFALTSGSVSETNVDGIAVEIPLSSPAKGDGQVGIGIGSGNAVYGIHFTTLPAMENNILRLKLSHSQTVASFTILPINNDLFTEDLTRAFTILEGGGVVQKGSAGLSYSLTIVDDEEPSIASFAIATVVAEEAESGGTEVEIQFSNPAAGTGQIILEIQGYHGRFTSKPEIVEKYEYYDYYDFSYHYSYSIQLDVAPYAEAANFTIFPIDDMRCNSDGPTTFTISAVSGVIRMGESRTLDLAIRDNEDPMIVTLQETEGTLNENDAAGKEIKLNFSMPAAKDGSISVSLNFYNKHDEGRYTTVPEMRYASGSYTSLDFKKGDTGVKIKVLPVDDNVAKGSFTEPFHLIFSPGEELDDGCVQIKDPIYTLTFVEDDD